MMHTTHPLRLAPGGLAQVAAASILIAWTASSLGCAISSVATFEQGATSADPRAAGKPAGRRLVPVLGVGGHAIVQGDGDTLRRARRVLVLNHGWTRRGSADATSVAIETALLRAGRIPLLPPVPGDAPACCDADASSLDSDLERAMAAGELANTDLILHLSAPTDEESLLVPCTGGALCPASAVGPSQIVDPPPCLPERAYPTARVSTLLGRAIEPGTGRVVAVIRAVSLPNTARVHERRLEHGGGHSCLWMVEAAPAHTDRASAARALLALMVKALVSGASVQGAGATATTNSGPPDSLDARLTGFQGTELLLETGAGAETEVDAIRAKQVWLTEGPAATDSP